ncbi:MAG: cation-transporting P-type ATPase, partial [Bacteroidaceae bacterium]|nr:cation-transporting P-type ATPase [Bacteroidaceae bacterium]
MKKLFRFRKKTATREVYNSEYDRYISRMSAESVISTLQINDHGGRLTSKINSVSNASHSGLEEHDIEERRKKYGPNVVAHEERTNPVKLFVQAFINPFVGVLTALIVISFILDVLMADQGEKDWTTIIIISTMVMASAVLRFVQELKANRSSDALLRMVTNTCYVERAQHSGEIPVEELVPGDIVLLSAGDMIPAAIRILERKDFFVSQSPLTGESKGIEKTPQAGQT